MSSNCEVLVSAAEMPGCDGSSLPYAEALADAEFVEQASLRPALVVREITRLGNEDSWVEARPAPSWGLSIKFHLDYGMHSSIGTQTLTLPVTPTTAFAASWPPAAPSCSRAKPNGYWLKGWAAA